MELPQPPQDQELKNIIDKLAQFVARNGPEFEQMTKTKQKDNPKFSFLFGGDFFNYYQYKVTTEQAILKHRQSREQNIMIHSSQMVSQSQPPMATYPNQSGPGGFNSGTYPFPYPNASGYGGGDGQQYPPGVVMNNYHQPHPFQMGPPGNEGQMQMGTGPSNSGPGPGPGPGPGFRPPFPTNDPSFGSSFPNQSNNPDDHYSQPHGSFPPNQPPIMAPGTEHSTPSNTNGFQQPSLPPPPPPSTSCDPGPTPVPSIGPSMAPSGQLPPQGVQTSLENVNYEIHQLKEQIKQSELNLSAQRQVLEQQNEMHVREGVYVAKGEELRKEASDLGLNIQEFEDLLTPITESCTKDSISNGKQWIFTRAITPQSNAWISQYLLYKSTCISGPFTHKLHIIYLMNDVLHHCLRKNADDLKESLEKVLSPMYCHAVSCATEDQKTKLDKLLSLWESKMHLDDHLLNQLHSPIESWNSYEKEKLNEFPQVVTTVSQHMNATLEGYQQQHNAFVQHATSQIQQLEQQKHHLEQQKHHLEQQQSQQQQQQSQQSQQQQQQQQPPPPPPPQQPQRPGVMPGPPPPQGNFVQIPPHGQHPPHQFMPPHVQGGPHQPGMSQGMDFNQPPPGFHTGSVPVIDFSKPPPGFPADDSKENLIPSVPYFELPAGLMTPLVKAEDNKYKPIDPSQIRLPVPTPPSERLLCAVENFYQPPSHDRPRNCEGWEQLALYDYYKAKSMAAKEKERLVQESEREKSRSPSPIVMEHVPEDDEPKPLRPVRRYRSVSPDPKEEPRETRSKSVSEENRRGSFRRSSSHSPPNSPQRFRPQRSQSKSPPKRSRSGTRSRSRSRSNSRSRSQSRSRSRSRTRSRTRSRSRSHSRSRSQSPVRVPFKKSRSRSLTPPSFGLQSFPPRSEGIDESNKGHQMLRSMGWSGSGSGLGVKEQGMAFPISAGEVRETPQERFRGLGVPTPQSDPYEAFRKNKGQAFINRMKARAEEKY